MERGWLVQGIARGAGGRGSRAGCGDGRLAGGPSCRCKSARAGGRGRARDAARAARRHDARASLRLVREAGLVREVPPSWCRQSSTSDTPGSLGKHVGPGQRSDARAACSARRRPRRRRLAPRAGRPRGMHRHGGAADLGAAERHPLAVPSAQTALWRRRRCRLGHGVRQRCRSGVLRRRGQRGVLHHGLPRGAGALLGQAASGKAHGSVGGEFLGGRLSLLRDQPELRVV
mmetsp:Transcript_32932/g.90853  ORF Transcript_32932/g.90853 Transcript_32932/m.90853 type:complete len:231 (+) Transcript_32932:514-1206(+)